MGIDAVLECVGTQDVMMQPIRSTQLGGSVGYVGISHGVEFNGEKLFFTRGRNNSRLLRR